jgi:hypothetical protein
MSTNLVSELERLANALEEDNATSSEVSLPAIAERIAKNLGVKNGRDRDPGRIEPVAAFAFSRAASTEECGIHPPFEHVGAGSANGTRQSRGD